MSRSSLKDELERRLREHLAIAETHTPEQSPLDVRAIAAALGVSPTTLYKYSLNREINEAAQRRRKNLRLSGAAIERQFFRDQAADLRRELEEQRQRNKTLIAQIAIMEANAARLGFNPEEMYKPILKPLRTVSRAGGRPPNLRKKSSRTIFQQ